MTDKITFNKLVEMIAAKTDHSESFTHDFVKDLVAEIRNSLQNDEKVNIAKLGKFELHHVDEKEGFNPQTREKMTIPAHSKAVFKPYKDLRETVNAPFAHLEAQLIAEEESGGKNSNNKEDKDGKIISFEPSASTSEKKSVNGEASSPKAEQEIPEFLSSAGVNDYRELATWIGGGLAVLAVSAGAWFFLTKNE